MERTMNIDSLVTNQPRVEDAKSIVQSDAYQDITEEEKEREKFSLKYQRPRNTPELLLEVMHDYDQIKETFEAASEINKTNVQQRID